MYIYKKELKWKYRLGIRQLERKGKFMTINKKEIEKFFEDAREIRNFAIDGKNEIIKEKKRDSISSLNPRYIGVYLANYYSKNINKQFHYDLLK